jgi:hypothetical protein
MKNVSDNINYLQPTQFRIVIDRQRFPNIAFYAQSVNLPGLQVNPAPAPFRQYTDVPQVGDTFTYGELTMQAILDEDLNVYSEIYNWMQDMVKENFKEQSSGEDEPTMTDIFVSILSSHNNIIKTIKYRNAFVTSLGDIDMEVSTDATPVITFPVSFRFAYFEL